ncbi:hypothetical protein [Leeia sp.]|uniref:hypothetical protein n=1 Tax=Leeia sp. TaxID=2884678 RepID=UPI0035B13060
MRRNALRLLRPTALNPDDAQQQRKAFRIFLETLLLAELGEHLINDPAFQGMVDDIQTVMERQTETQVLIE